MLANRVRMGSTELDDGLLKPGDFIVYEDTDQVTANSSGYMEKRRIAIYGDGVIRITYNMRRNISSATGSTFAGQIFLNNTFTGHMLNASSTAFVFLTIELEVSYGDRVGLRMRRGNSGTSVNELFSISTHKQVPPGTFVREL